MVFHVVVAENVLIFFTSITSIVEKGFQDSGLIKHVYIRDDDISPFKGVENEYFYFMFLDNERRPLRLTFYYVLPRFIYYW